MSHIDACRIAFIFYILKVTVENWKKRVSNWPSLFEPFVFPGLGHFLDI